MVQVLQSTCCVCVCSHDNCRTFDLWLSALTLFIVKCVGQGHRSQFEIRGDSALFRLKVKELSGIISSGNVGRLQSACMFKFTLSTSREYAHYAVCLQRLRLKALVNLHIHVLAVEFCLHIEYRHTCRHCGGQYALRSAVRLAAWHSGRTSVCDRRTFPVIRSTCS